MIRQDYLNQIKPFMNKRTIKVITGIRGCGKSSLLQLIIDELKNQNIPDENIILINLDSKKFLNKNIEGYIQSQISNKSGKIYLFIDEVQNIPDWEKLIKKFSKCDIYLTLPNSNQIPNNRRFKEIKVYPFSYKEVKLIDENLTFEEYAKYGGMPFIYNLKDHNSKINYLNLLYDTIIYKDVKDINKIRNSELLDKIVLYIIDILGWNFTVSNLFNVLRNEKRSIKKDTIYNYLKYLESSGLINKIQRNNVRGNKIINFNEKYYLTDWGFNEIFFEDTSRYGAQILKNIICIELLRRGYVVNVGKKVDFVCSKDNKIFYIQVSYRLPSERTIERKSEPLLKIKDDNEKIIISTDKEDCSREGVKHYNIEDFLLSDDF